MPVFFSEHKVNQNDEEQIKYLLESNLSAFLDSGIWRLTPKQISEHADFYEKFGFKESAYKIRTSNAYVQNLEIESTIENEGIDPWNVDNSYEVLRLAEERGFINKERQDLYLHNVEEYYSRPKPTQQPKRINLF